MRRLWLLFAQTITIGLALWFIVTTLKPNWLRQTVPSRPIFAASAPATIQEVRNIDFGRQSSFRYAAQKAMPSVVNLSTSRTRQESADELAKRKFFGDEIPQRYAPPASSGSGVIVSPQGHILTNNHMVDGADTISVALSDGRTAQAYLIGTDPDTDLAVIKIDLDNLSPITLANEEHAGVGDVVLAIGNPFGVGQTVTMGIISAMGRNGMQINSYENFIQTDAAVNPGNSGGALVDTDGNLLGINTAIYSRNGGSLGIGFAIPSSTIKHVLEAILTHGEVVRGWIGVEARDITPEMAESFNIKDIRGSIIEGVFRNGPAFEAGIKPGDIITQVGDKQVRNTTEMLYLIADLTPEAKAKFQILRQEKIIPIDVVVAKRKTRQNKK